MFQTILILSNKIASQRKTHAPRRFLYLRETQSWWCQEEEGEEGKEGEEGEGGEGGEEKVHLLTHATARGMGKKQVGISGFWYCFVLLLKFLINN